MRSGLNDFGVFVGGNEDLGPGGGRASRRMHRTTKPPLQNRPVDFAELFGYSWLVHADHNPVRMKEVFDGCPFPEKLRVRDDVEGSAAIPVIRAERALQLLAGMRRHGAFLNDHLGRTRLRA